METLPRNTPALLSRIDHLRNGMLKRFLNIVELAAIDKTDRNTTALNQYQMQVETAALIRTSEDILSMTRQMQELWLFGQLKTLDQKDNLQQKIDTDAKEVADMLAQLLSIKGLMDEESTNDTAQTEMEVDHQVDSKTHTAEMSAD